MFFYILFYVSMPFNEERTEFKKLQPITPFVYWTSVYLFDAVVHAMFCYFLYCVHIWIDTYHVFDGQEYCKCYLMSFQHKNQVLTQCPFYQQLCSS